MVYMTTVLLLGVVVALNLAAILIRERLRRKLRSATF
jgi:ABC-type phosphate transport system permease subunit